MDTMLQYVVFYENFLTTALKVGFLPKSHFDH